MTDLEKAYKAITAKLADYTLLWRYYEGDQPLVYSVDRLREVFQSRSVNFAENWCAVVIDAVLERLQLQRFIVPDNDAINEQLSMIVKRLELDIEDDSVHLAALVCGESFLIVWPDEDGKPEAYYNDPRLCHVEYDADNPHLKLWAAKWWKLDKVNYLNIYYPDRIEKYVANKENVGAYSAFQLSETDANPYGVIPVFHFRRDRRKPLSELVNVIPVQDAINKLSSDMMIAAEFGAFKQRWVISNADVGVLKNSPNEIWNVPAGDGVGQQAQVGEFGETQLSNYIEAIQAKVAAVSAISRTPHHFFFQAGGIPSGEALVAMEAPLNKKTERYVNVFGRTWQRVIAFVLQLYGIDVDEDEIEVQFAEPQTVQPRSEAEIGRIRRETALLDQQLGVSQDTLLGNLGYNAEEERQKRESEGADMAETMLTAFDRDRANA